ncbi:hypothetical protein ABE083_00850 [Bacillus mycoides]|uniref:hypothetical protein n=1 Tax=Bacillus mycoides TaxID=1405 RepID=UPI001F366B7E|nr:hypothetical protein [Bacillus mycoides]
MKMDEIDLNHRYWCFGFDQYYPCGGFADIHILILNKKRLNGMKKKKNVSTIVRFGIMKPVSM